MPDRELADQVGKQIRKLATGIPNLKLLLLVGGVPLGPQLASLEGHDPHVVVGTPGRVQELARKRALNLGAVRTLVLDEADRMLDMGFEEPIREIAGRTHKDRQSLLFSATFPDSIRAMARDLLRDAVEVTVEGADQAPAIRHLFCEVEPAHRQKALAGLLLKYTPESAVGSATPARMWTKWPTRYSSSASPHWPCMATWSSATARKCCCCWPTAAATYWWPATWPHVAWTWKSWRQ